jgi:hypothetical protein
VVAFQLEIGCSRPCFRRRRHDVAGLVCLVGWVGWLLMSPRCYFQILACVRVFESPNNVHRSISNNQQPTTRLLLGQLPGVVGRSELRRSQKPFSSLALFFHQQIQLQQKLLQIPCAFALVAWWLANVGYETTRPRRWRIAYCMNRVLVLHK